MTLPLVSEAGRPRVADRYGPSPLDFPQRRGEEGLACFFDLPGLRSQWSSIVWSKAGPAGVVREIMDVQDYLGLAMCK